MCRSLILLLGLLMALDVTAINVKKLQTLLAKGQHQKVITTITLELNKTPNDPAIWWFLSTILIDDQLPYYNPDSARIIVEKADSLLENTSATVIASYQKQGFDLNHLVTHTTDKVKEILLQRAVTSPSISSLEEFAKWYPNAIESAVAVRMRDSLAYEAIKSSTNLADFESYLENYSDSFWAKQALDKLHLLRFQHITANQSKSSFETYIAQYPDGPYVSEATIGIFKHIRRSDQWDYYVDFLKRYEKSPEVPRILNRLYQISPDRFFKLTQLNLHPNIDSLIAQHNAAQELWLPIWHLGTIGFVNAGGESRFPNILDQVFEKDLFCDVFTSNIIAGKVQDKSVIFNRLGDKIYEGNFNEITDLGLGILKLCHGISCLLIQKSGKKIIENVQDAVLFDQKWIKVKRKSKWGIVSPWGDELTPLIYDEINVKGSFWVFAKDGRLAVTNEHAAIIAFEWNAHTLEFKFDELEPVTDDLLVGISDKKECLLGSDLKFIIAWGNYQIYPDEYVSYAKNTSGNILLFDYPLIEKFGGEKFDQIQSGANWLCLKKDKKWYVWNRLNDELSQHDSVLLVNSFVLWVSNTVSQQVQFVSGQKVNLFPKQTISQLRSESGNATYLIIAGEKSKSVWDSKGKFLFHGFLDEIIVLSDSLFRMSVRKKQGVIDAEGYYVLEPEYDFVRYQDGMLQLLKDGKIGAYDLQIQQLFAEQYEGNFEKIGEFYLTKRNGLFGIIDREQKRIANFIYQAILLVNDTLFWGKKDDMWELVHVHNQTKILSNISTQKLIYTKEKVNYYLIYNNQKGYGIFSTQGGLILPLSFTDIKLMPGKAIPFFIGEVFHDVTSYYIVTCKDAFGKILYTSAYPAADYETFYCE